jgi:peptidoglycan-N-acetylglucosamine deacetylase
MRTVPLRSALAVLICLSLNGMGAAALSTCSGNPEALGVSRIIEVNPAGAPRLGTLQYPTSLDLAPMEVVLTFDDGPRPKTTEKVLDVLDEYCVKATFLRLGNGLPPIPI